MPQVPMLQDQTRLTTQGPSDLVDTHSFGKGNLAAAQLWESAAQAGEKLTQTGLELEQRLQRSRQVAQLSDFNNAAQEQIFNLKKLVKEHPDPETWSPSFKQGAQDWLDNQMENIQDEAVKAHAQQIWGKMYWAGMQTVNAAAEKRTIANLAGNVESSFNRSIELYGQADSDLEQAGIKSRFFGMLSGAVEAGYLLPLKAEQLRQGFDSQVKQNVFTAAGEADPFGTMKNIDQFGLGGEQRRHGISWLEGRISKAQQDNAVLVDQAFDEGKLTMDMVKQMRDTKQINLSTSRFYEGALQAGLEAKAVTDMDVYIPLLRAAQNNKMDQEQVFTALQAGKLKKDDAKYLMAMQEKIPDDMRFMKDPALKMGFNAALHEIQARLRPLDNNRMEKMQREFGMGTVRPEAMYENQAAVSFINAAKAAAKSGELTGDWMLKKAVEISKPFEMQGMSGLLRAPRPGGAPAPAPAAPARPFRIMQGGRDVTDSMTEEQYRGAIQGQGGR